PLTTYMNRRNTLYPLRRGRLPLHRIAAHSISFADPHRLGDRMRSLVSWSRLFIDEEILVAFNTDESRPVTVYSTVAPIFRVEGDQLHLIFWYAPRPSSEPPPSLLPVERKGGLLAVRMMVPPAGFVMYQASPGLHRLGPSPPPDLKPWQPR